MLGNFVSAKTRILDVKVLICIIKMLHSNETNVIVIGNKKNLNLKSKADVVAVERKKFAGKNQQHSSSLGMSKLVQETEELKHQKLDLNIGKIIQQARNAKKLTQVELAKAINEKLQIINEYEQAKTIPNQQILTKLEKVLNVKLKGKNIGTQIY